MDGVFPEADDDVVVERELEGHAILAVGYDGSKGPHGAVLVRNSWGSWTVIPDDKDMVGHFWLPYSWLEVPGRTDDLWAINVHGIK